MSLYPSLEEFMVQEEITSRTQNQSTESNNLEIVKVDKGENQLVLSDPEVYQKVVRNEGVRCIQFRKNQGIKFTFQSYNSGIFINNLNQPAVDLGLHFGDQLVNLNGVSLTGLTKEKAEEHYQLYDPSQLITLMVRDRPYSKVITLNRSPQDQKLGFIIKNGYITELIKGSSAHLNGLLTGHKLAEINGKPVYHLKDSEIIKELKETKHISVHLTIFNREFYEKLTKRSWW